MGFFEFLRFILMFVVYFLMWQIGRWIVLPHIKIFPYIPPNPVWEAVYAVLLAAGRAFFWIAICIVAFLYITYWVVDNIIRYIFPPFSMAIAEILLNISPLKDFREIGLWNLINQLREIVFSTKSLKDRFVDVFKALAEFLLLVTGVGKRMELVKQDLKERNERIQKKIDSVKINVKEETDEDENIKDKKDKDKIVKEEKSYEEKIAEAEYDKCMYENVNVITEDMNPFERLVKEYNNNVNSTKCEFQLAKNIAQLENSK